MFRIQQVDTQKYLVPPPKPRGEGNALSRNTDDRRANRGRAPADGGEADLGAPAVGGEVDPGAPEGNGEADLGAPAVGRELDPGTPAFRGEVEPDAPVISGEVEATGALTSPAASAGAHKPVPLTSTIVKHASSAPVLSDKSPVSISLWFKLLSKPRDAYNSQEQSAAVAREIENLHSGSILSQTPRLNRNQEREATYVTPIFSATRNRHWDEKRGLQRSLKKDSQTLITMKEDINELQCINERQASNITMMGTELKEVNDFKQQFLIRARTAQYNLGHQQSKKKLLVKNLRKGRKFMMK